MKINKNQIKQIEKFVYGCYKKLDQTHGIEHLKRTVKLSTYLAKKEKADIQIVKLGAMLHQFHNKIVVENFLKKIKIDRNAIRKIVDCVPNYSKDMSKAKTTEAKVVYDADKLQVIGPFGVMRELSCDMVAPRNMNFRVALEHTRMIEQKCFKTLQTKTAKKLAKEPHDLVVKFWKTLDKWDNVRM